MNYPDTQHSLLVYCGLFQGGENSVEGESAAERLAIELSQDAIKTLVANRVHVDHVGCIPVGFICSDPYAKLLPIVLEDAIKFGFRVDQKQVERYIKLIEQRIIALLCKTWFHTKSFCQKRSTAAHQARPQSAGVRATVGRIQ